jgi:hypothetical protein
VPSTPLPSGQVDLLGPTANHMPMALCSPRNVEGGGEWDNGSIDIRANMASIWANFWDILAHEFWGREFSVMASENGAVEQYDDIAGADSIGGTAVGQYPPPRGCGGGRRICCAPRLM